MRRWNNWRGPNSRTEDDDPGEFDHREVYGASFETLEALCFREWGDSIESVGDTPPGEEKSAIYLFANSHHFENISLSVGEIVIPISEL